MIFYLLTMGGLICGMVVVLLQAHSPSSKKVKAPPTPKVLDADPDKVRKLRQWHEAWSPPEKGGFYRWDERTEKFVESPKKQAASEHVSITSFEGRDIRVTWKNDRNVMTDYGDKDVVTVDVTDTATGKVHKNLYVFQAKLIAAFRKNKVSQGIVFKDARGRWDFKTRPTTPIARHGKSCLACGLRTAQVVDMVLDIPVCWTCFKKSRDQRQLTAVDGIDYTPGGILVPSPDAVYRHLRGHMDEDESLKIQFAEDSMERGSDYGYTEVLRGSAEEGCGVCSNWVRYL